MYIEISYEVVNTLASYDSQFGDRMSLHGGFHQALHENYFIVR